MMTTQPAGKSPAAEAHTVVQERRATYGDPKDNFKRIAALWSAYLDHSVSVEDVAYMMALLKLARLKHDPAHWDSKVDAIGYIEALSL